ncbi:serine/threonine protein kinase [Candidatus Uabimicrobium amorphum]|uniref:Protein kinase n=1 Tax=Uabimicrobium amorphum TaxID=2596890 RepID=A0A5S9IM96_UABAM|nr:serine/threonine-protein kinase [Candidatus Uabimicrobium amorphum]BBM84117.1 protein kinase [Candidatus Uabimicrobium amorphum]
MSQNWFIRSKTNGNLFGPYTVDLMKTYITQGRIDANYMISSNKKHWQEISDWVASEKKRIGKYKIIRELGRGGMGAVYLAYDSHLQRQCALKVMLNNNDADALKRFQLEAKAVAQIQHPNIIHIYDICQTPYHFFVMDYIEGIPLDEYIIRLSIQQKVKLFAKICDAIAFAHSKNILHRDLKPANILVRHDGEPIVVDFGLAKNIKQQDNLTKTGDVFGTPKYMAPEISQGTPGTHQVDVYALGIILYEMLTGRVPFDGENHLELLYQITMSEPIPPSKLNSSIPKEGDLETICLKALEKSPQKRISSVRFLHKEIQSFLQGERIRLKPPSRSQKIIKWVRNHAIQCSIFVLVCLASIFYLWTNNVLRDKGRTVQLDLNKKLIDNKEQVFRSKNDLVNTKRESIYNYLHFKTDEQFFHLEVADKLKDLEEKIAIEKKLEEEYISLKNRQDRYHRLQRDGDPYLHRKDLDDLSADVANLFERLKAKDIWSESHAAMRKQENTRYYQRLDDHLRFSVLPNFPSKTTHALQKNVLSVCVSPKNNYIAQKTVQGKWLLWKKPFGKILTTDKAIVLDCLPRTFKKSYSVFSPDEKLLVVGESQNLYFVDLSTQSCVSYPGQAGNVAFGTKNDLVSFFFEEGAKDFVGLFSRSRNKLIKKFHAQEVFFADFGNNHLVMMYNRGILVYDLQSGKISRHPTKTDFSRRRVAINRQENQLIFVSRLSLKIFDLKSKKMQIVPFEFPTVDPSLKHKNFTMLGRNQFAFLRNSGEIIISYLSPLSNQDNTLLSSRRLRSSDKSIYKLDFAPQYFLGAFTDTGIDIISSTGGEKIITIDKPQFYTGEDTFVNGHLATLQNGLQVSLVTKKYCEQYFFPFKKYLLDKVTQKLILQFTNFYKASEEVTRDTLVSEDFLICTSVLGFLVWKNGKFITSCKVLKSPDSFELSNNGKYLAILFKASEIRLYDMDTFTKQSTQPQNVDLLGRSGRKYLRELGRNNEEIRRITFTTDNKSLLLVKPDLQLYSMNIETKKLRCLVPSSSQAKYQLTNMLHTNSGYVLVGINEISRRNGGFAIFTPHNKRSIKIRKGNYTSAIAVHNTRFAIAADNGRVEIYENFAQQKKIMEFKSAGKPLRLLFSPNGHYLAIFTMTDIYICNLKIYHPHKTNDIFRIYRGHFKSRVGIFSNDWKKVYFATTSGDIVVFDQSFFVDHNAYQKRVKQLNQFSKKNYSETLNKLDELLK